MCMVKVSSSCLILSVGYFDNLSVENSIEVFVSCYYNHTSILNFVFSTSCSLFISILFVKWLACILFPVFITFLKKAYHILT